MAIIGSAEIEVLPDTRRFASKAEADVTPQAEGLGRKMGALIGGAIAVGGAFEFVKSSVDAFSEAQQGVLKLDSALKTNAATAGLTSSAFDGLNKKIMATTTFNTEASQTVEGQLSLYHLTAGQIKELTPLVEDYAARTGKDVTSAAKLAGAAILGKGRALKDVGIAFKDLKDPTKNYTELVGGLRQQVGGFASKEGQTFQGRMQILRNEFHEFQVEVGQRVVPILTALVGFFVSRLLPGIGALAGIVERTLAPAFQQIGWLVQAFMAALRGEGITESSGIFNIVERLGVLLRGIFVQLSNAGEIIRSVFAGDGWVAAGNFERVIADLAVVVKGFVDFVKANMAPSLGALGALLLVTVVPAFIAWAAGAISAAVATVIAAAPVIALAAAIAALGFGIIWAYEHVQIFRDIVTAIADYFTTSFVPQMQAVGAFIVDVWNQIYSVGKTVFDALAAAVRWFLDNPVKWISDQIATLTDWWRAHWDEIRAVAVFVFQAIADYVAVVWQVIVAEFRVAMDVILPIVQVGWQILQASFHYTFDLIAGVVRVAWDEMVGIFTTAKDLILGVVGVLLDLLTGKWGRAWADLKTTVSNVLGDIAGTIGKVLGDVVQTVENLGTDVFNAARGIGEAIVHGIVNGIESLIGDVGSAISHVVGSAVDHLPGPIKAAVKGVIGIFGDGGFVPGPVGQPQLAVVHGGEFVLSNEMLRGARPAPVAASAAGFGVAPGAVTISLSFSGVPDRATMEMAGRIAEEHVTAGLERFAAAHGNPA